MDDTHTNLDAGQGQVFTDHLNSLDLDIHFTIEWEEEGALAFLNTNIARKLDIYLKITIYQKVRHTD